MAARKPAKKRATKKKPTGARTMTSPLSGAVCPTGAHPGNTGGKPGRSGRLPSAVRESCREAFADRIPRLMAIADGAVSLIETCPKCGHTAASLMLPVTDTADIRGAIDQLGKYGLGERSNSLDRDSVEMSITIQRDIIREMLEPELARAVLRRIAAEAWE